MEEKRYIILDAHDNEALHRNSDVPPHLMNRRTDAAAGSRIGETSLNDALAASEADGDAARDRTAAESRPLRQAAVLMPLVHDKGEWHLLFIRRASNERDRHSGQVAFPGGRRDPQDDSLQATALRETHEEIGVPASAIDILGTLDRYITVSHYQVAPVVARMHWPQKLVLEPSEVDRAFLIPLDWLQQRKNFTLRARKEMDPQSARRHPIIVYNEFDNEVLWGASARMTLNFLKAVEDGELLLPPVS